MINLVASAVALLAVLTLAYFVIKGGAKLSGLNSRSGAVRLIGSTAVGSRERLVLVSYNNQRYLLGVTAQSVNIIDKHEDDSAVADQTLTTLS